MWAAPRAAHPRLPRCAAALRWAPAASCATRGTLACQLWGASASSPSRLPHPELRAQPKPGQGRHMCCARQSWDTPHMEVTPSAGSAGEDSARTASLPRRCACAPWLCNDRCAGRMCMRSEVTETLNLCLVGTLNLSQLWGAWRVAPFVCKPVHIWLSSSLISEGLARGFKA